MRKVCVMCSKGGTGKSTTAVNVAAGVADQGKKVLLIDCDAQGNASAHRGAKAGPTIYDVLIGEASWDTAKQTIRTNLDLIPATISLSAVSVFLMQQKNPVNVMRRRFGNRCV